MRKRIIQLALVVLILSLTATLISTATAKPGPIFILTLQDKMGAPVKDKTFIIAIFDITDNERIAGVEVTSDTEGKVEFELAEDLVDTHDYNITIVIEEYGKTFAFYYATLTGSALRAINETAVTGTHYWNLYFYAGTDLATYPPTTCDVPVYFVDPEDPSVVDAAEIKVYIDETEVWSDYVESSGITGTTFNVSDLIVEVDEEYHVKAVANTTFMVQALWTEHKLIVANQTVFFEKDGDVPTLAEEANEIVTYDDVRDVYITWTADWTVTESTTKASMPLTNSMEVLARSYTRLLVVKIKDWEGNDVFVGTTPVKVFVEYGT